MELEEISRIIQNCKKCPLHKTRTNAVPGEGNPSSKIVFIGEAPGRWEDEQGKPFVGRAGKLLTEILNEFGISREEVFITNIVKCRPPQNRRPEKIEIEACGPYLNQQIETINPKIIATLGATSGEYIFNKYGLHWEGMLRENGKVHTVQTLFGSLKIIPVIHPAAVLRDPNKRNFLENAIKNIKDFL